MGVMEIQKRKEEREEVGALTLTRPSMESYDLYFTEEEMRLRWAGFLAPGLTAPVRPA